MTVSFDAVIINPLLTKHTPCMAEHNTVTLTFVIIYLAVLNFIGYF